MGYKTFSQLPIRSTATKDDFIISDRSNASTSPEARIKINTLKDYVLKGSLDENGFLQKTQNLSILRTNAVVDVKNGNNLITFDNLNKNVYGLFEIRCTYSAAPSTLAAIYSLSWNNSEGRQIRDINLITNRVLDVKKDTTDKDGLSTHHLFIPPFQPRKPGWFRFDVKFTSNISNKKAAIDIDIWTFQIK
jgi:hypothetical protein